jgi:hypothetical protein
MIFGGTLALAALVNEERQLFPDHDFSDCSWCRRDVSSGLHDWITDQAIKQGLRTHLIGEQRASQVPGAAVFPPPAKIEEM